MMRVSEDRMAALVERYPEFSGCEEGLRESLEFILRLREEVADAEDPRFDDAQVTGLRFFKAYSKYASVNEAPSAIHVVDAQKGVLALYGVPIKVYGAVPGAGPRRNKTTVGTLEADAACQTTLGSIAPEFDEGARPPKNVLIRVEVDDGIPQLLRWEEYSGNGVLEWPMSLLVDADDTPTSTIVAVTPRQPPPTRPTRDPVLPPGGDVLEPGVDDDGDERD